MNSTARSLVFLYFRPSRSRTTAPDLDAFVRKFGALPETEPRKNPNGGKAWPFEVPADYHPSPDPVELLSGVFLFGSFRTLQAKVGPFPAQDGSDTPPSALPIMLMKKGNPNWRNGSGAPDPGPMQAPVEGKPEPCEPQKDDVAPKQGISEADRGNVEKSSSPACTKAPPADVAVEAAPVAIPGGVGAGPAGPLVAAIPKPNPVATKFFRELYGEDTPGYINVWTLPDKLSHFFPAANLELAANKAMSLALDHDVYFSVCPLREALSGGRRGSAEDTVALAALWIDIDIRGDNHKQTTLPETPEQALELAYALPWAPSTVVSSGGGLQVYWIFKEPWVFEEGDREQAARLSKTFQALLIAKGTERGWRIDDTSDLARVLRVPGTYNRKHGETLVRILENHPERCFSPSDFSEYLSTTPSAGVNIHDHDVGPPDPIERIMEGVAEGTRDNTAARRFGRWFRLGLSDAEVWGLAVVWNEKNQPPLTEAELRKTFQSIRKADNGKGRAAAVGGPSDDEEQARRADQGTDDVPWPEPGELPQLLPPAPPMVADLLPEAFKGWLQDITHRMQVPLEMPTAAVIVALSAVVGRKLAILTKRHDDWQVIPNLWGMIVSPPGTMKTPTLKQAFGPLEELVAEAEEAFNKRAATNAARLLVKKAEIVAVKAQLDKAAKLNKTEEKDELARQIVKLEQECTDLEAPMPRILVKDATVEKLHELLRDNPNGLIQYRDELSGWLACLDKAGREGDRQFYNESWSGDGSHVCDRIIRGTVNAKHICMSVFGGIQPGRLKNYIDDAIAGADRDDGLLQRFQLAVYPDEQKSWDLIDQCPDYDARQRAYRVFRILHHLSSEEVGASLPKYNSIPSLSFDNEAQEIFFHWLEAHQRRVLFGKVGPAAFVAHLSKYRSLMPSLALLFHLISWADSTIDGAPAPPLKPVSAEAARMAISWCELLEKHALKVWAGMLQPDVQASHALAEKILAGKVKDGSPLRDLYRAQWALLQKREAVAGALATLCEAGWLRIITRQTEGKSKECIVLNPKLKTKGTE